MWHVELLDLDRDRFVKVVPEILDNDQLVRLKETCLKFGYVMFIEFVESEAK